MLRSAAKEVKAGGAETSMREAAFPSPFVSGLEYGAPARGTWNIVHTGMLMPEAHQIFVCATCCLRGVVLTAAEMNEMKRFSTVVIKENNVLEGDMEELIIDGIADILNNLPNLPPAVLVFTSCIHHFMGCDLPRVYNELRKKFPDVRFTDCYMNPIMRKSGLTPDQLMRRQLYSFLEPAAKSKKVINYIGNDLSVDDSSDISRLLRENGFEIRDITKCKTFVEYLKMSEAFMNIVMIPSAVASGAALEQRLNQKYLYLPACFGFDENERNIERLCDELKLPKPDYTSLKERAKDSLARGLEIVGNAEIAIDYTAVMRPLGLARLLLENGYNVKRVYLDTVTSEEKPDFDWLKENAPDLMLMATVHPKMRMLPRGNENKILAIGQKAAYFMNTEYFVNIVEGGGMYGFDGISRMVELIIEAFSGKKDMKNLIQAKGLGCESCI